MDQSQETAAVDVNDEGKYVMTFNTAEVGLNASENPYILTVKFVETANLDDTSATFSITVNKATPTVSITADADDLFGLYAATAQRTQVAAMLMRFCLLDK